MSPRRSSVSAPRMDGYRLLPWLLLAPALVRATAISSLVSRTEDTNAKCGPSFQWAYNSQGLNPCLLTAFVYGSCFTGNWYVPALTEGQQYTNPNSTTANTCTCSWAAYNLISACTACQNFSDSVQNWAAYNQACTPYLTNGSYFPANVELPAGTLIPFYAGTNPQTWPNGKFDVPTATALAAENKPDYTPSVSTSSKSKTPIGAIAGGVVGGVAVILGGILAFCCIRSRSKQAGDGVPRSESGHRREFSGPTSIRTFLSRPTVHGRSMSDLSRKSILSSNPTHGQALSVVGVPAPSVQVGRSGTIHTTRTFHTTTGSDSLSYLSGYGSPMTSPGPQALHFQPIQPVNAEEVIEPFMARSTPHAASRKASESTINTTYHTQENSAASASGSAAVTPGTPAAVAMTSYMDAVPEGATVDYSRVLNAQQTELERLNQNTSPPAYTPYASPSASPEPQVFGHRKGGIGASVDSSRSYATTDESYGNNGDSISGLHDMVGRMGLAMPASPSVAAPTTVATGQSGAMSGSGKATVSNP